MAQTTASFSVALEDKTSGPAESAAKALEKLRGSIQKDQKALREMQGAMRRLQGGTSVNVKAFRELQGKIDAHRQKISEAEASYISLGGSFGKLKKARPGKPIENLSKSAARAHGPLGALVDRLDSMKAALAGGAVVAIVVALAAAVVAVGAAAAAAVAKLAAYALAQSNAARAEHLRLEALTKLRFFEQRTRGNADEMQASMDRVADATGANRAELERYTGTLHRMGLSGANLDAALEGMAIRGQVLGDRYANAFAGMAAATARAGGDVRKLSDAVRARLGGILERKLMDWNVQIDRLHRNLARMFGGLKIEGFLRGMKQITDLFSQTTVTGRALKTIVETLFQPLIDRASVAAPIVKRFFQGMVLAAQGLTIAILKVRLWIKRTFGDSQILSGLDTTMLAAKAGTLVFSLLAAAVITAVAAFAALGTAIAAVTAPIWAPVLAAQALKSKLTELWHWLEGKLPEWGDLGKRIVDGLVQGITHAGSRLWSAVTHLGTQAKRALMSALDIHSPSRVFAGLGVQIPRGLAAGIEKDSPVADRAVRGIVSASADIGGGESGGGGATAARGSIAQVSIGDVHIHTDSEDPKSMARDFVDELSRALEGTVVTMGATL